MFSKHVKNKVVSWVSEVIGMKGITLQHDGVTSYKARTLQEWCKGSFKAFWSKEGI